MDKLQNRPTFAPASPPAAHCHALPVPVPSLTPNNTVVLSTEGAPQDFFPDGLRVLVVDDDPVCLLMLQTLLRRCLYQVTTCAEATMALSLLRENKDKFDLVISDVYMPDMDGFKLLELVALEMDLPVIMISANGETSAVMKGITHGACDYLLKPVRMEELKNIWQHVVRKKRKMYEKNSWRGKQNEWYKLGVEDSNHLTSSINDVKLFKKRKVVKENEDDYEQEIEDSSMTKKPRVVWSVELHQQFVNAVNQLGIDKAVPKRILELMNVDGLTRENVASHLQKYRLYLKRVNNVPSYHINANLGFVGTQDAHFSSFNPTDGLIATGQLSSQALASLQAGAFSRFNMANGVDVTGINSCGFLELIPYQGNDGAVFGMPQFSSLSLSNQESSLLGSSRLDSEKVFQRKSMLEFSQFGTETDGAEDANVLKEQFPLAGPSIACCEGIHDSDLKSTSSHVLSMQLSQHLQPNQARRLVNLSTTSPLGQQHSSSGFKYAHNHPTAETLIGCIDVGRDLQGIDAAGRPLKRLSSQTLPYRANVSWSFSPASILNPNRTLIPMECSFTAPTSKGISLPLASENHLVMKEFTIPDTRDDSKSVNNEASANGLGTNSFSMANLDLGFKQVLNQNMHQGPHIGPFPACMLNPQPGHVSHEKEVPSVVFEYSAMHNEVAKNQKLDLPGFSLVNHSTVVPATKMQCDSEQSTAERAFKMKDHSPLETYGSAKAGGWIGSTTHCSSAEDLINLLYRQEGVNSGKSSEENDMTFTDYSFQNLYLQ